MTKKKGGRDESRRSGGTGKPPRSRGRGSPPAPSGSIHDGLLFPGRLHRERLRDPQGKAVPPLPDAGSHGNIELDLMNYHAKMNVMVEKIIKRTVLEEIRRDIRREEGAFLIGPRQAGKTRVQEIGRG